MKRRSRTSKRPLVGVIMGSSSDWPILKEAALLLKSFGVPFEAKVVSAHRTPNEMARYAQTAAGRGLRVIIAGAGGAAHLPGMVASYTPLPVIGVPVPTKKLKGLDSLLSVAQMPSGVPVACVAVGAAANAALLAVQILSSGLPEKEAARLQNQMMRYKKNLRRKVLKMKLPKVK